MTLPEIISLVIAVFLIFIFRTLKWMRYLRSRRRAVINSVLFFLVYSALFILYFATYKEPSYPDLPGIDLAPAFAMLFWFILATGQILISWIVVEIGIHRDEKPLHESFSQHKNSSVYENEN